MAKSAGGAGRVGRGKSNGVDLNHNPNDSDYFGAKIAQLSNDPRNWNASDNPNRDKIYQIYKRLNEDQFDNSLAIAKKIRKVGSGDATGTRSSRRAENQFANVFSRSR